MIKVLMVCHGNICRSTMAEFLFKDMVKKEGLEDQFYIASAGTSAEELGNPVHRGTRKILDRLGISYAGKYATQLRKSDGPKYDFFLGMDDWNIRNMQRILGREYESKIHLLLEYAKNTNTRGISDPWYTGDFETTYEDVLEGCRAFLNYLKKDGYVA